MFRVWELGFWVGVVVFHGRCCLFFETSSCFLFATGQLVWRHHAELPAPSRQAICATCTQLLPLLEMFCRYELQEDVSDLQALMYRFDSEAELESHALGRSLLFLVRDVEGNAGLHHESIRTQLAAPPNPFDAVRARLSNLDLAIRGLQTQVQLIVGFNPPCNLQLVNTMALNAPTAFSIRL